MSRSAVRFDEVNIVFGKDPASALPLMDRDMERAEIQEETGQILGVHNCSLTVEPGEIVVIMGLSGSGKSTLLRAVNGLNPVVRGAVWVDDGSAEIDVATADEATLRRLRTSRVTMVFQNFALLPWRTVAENVGLGLELAGIARGEREERVAKQLELVGLDQWADRKVHELSGGMQQRVGLARAFATEAPILLMDEPFSALDPLIRAKLQDELLDLQAQLQRTIIFVSHDLDEALKLGSKVAIMEGGRIVQFGTPQEIVLQPANRYVADFVSHMNPLNVLQAATVMRPVDTGGPVPGGAVALTAEDWPEGAIPIAEPDTPLADLMRARTRTAETIRVIADGKVIGEIGDGEIYSALLKE
ncbi:choline ABC transporter ATP-binding protein [Nisaea acidiphila]|uniref:Trimethylamine N-oxide transport system ATP-binding protein TmoW n=1 Tax=Nisaea acidiphila TaxID=1862145 RepID=A0A9J7ATF7_9PROT|nr:choline ABC transporter ATP-binding protein [Nisaea acidiphila]UUX50616.1 choline ABC transporter ATP-binding protein [Nisaea acidiphila]